MCGGGRIYLCFVHYIIFCISAPRIGFLPDSFKMGDASFLRGKLGAAGKKRRARAFGVECATGLSGEACRYRTAGINITGFAVDEKLRRTGIGRSLMEAVEHFAEQNGFAFIRAESGAMRKDAHAVYRKLNFYS